MSIWVPPDQSAIAGAAGKAADATTPDAHKSGLTDTYAHRQAWIKRVLSRPGGARKLAYYMKDLGYESAIAGNKGYKFALHGFLSLGEDPDQVKRYNAAWAKIDHPVQTPPGATPANRPPAGADGPPASTTPVPDPLATIAATPDPVASKDFSGILDSIDPNTQKLLNARKYANNQGAMMFDPQIAEVKLTQSRQGPQAKQNQLDISSWYKQVGDQQAQGLSATKSSNEAAIASVNSVGSNLVSAAGGNEAAAGLVGAASTNDAGTIAAIGAGDEALANRLKELTSLEGKSRGIDEKRYQAKLAQDTALQLTSLKGQKGAAIADALDKALAMNNESRQTNFANRLSQIQTEIGAEGLGMDLAGKQVDLATKKVGLAGDILTYQQAQQAIASGGRVFWNKMAPDARAGLVAAAVKAALGPKGNPIRNFEQTRRMAYNWAVQTAGINNPAFRQSVDRELTRLHPNWAAGNPGS